MFTADSYIWAILETPDDDGLRLSFADWLEDKGEIVHAEFIRLQCTLAEDPTEDDLWLKRKGREEELWKILQGQWCDIIQELGMRPFDVADFSRGFLRRPVHLSIEDVGVWLRADHRWTFFLEIASLRTLCLVIPEFLESPQMQRVVSLTCQRSGIEDETLEPFRTSGHFSRLRTLDLFQNIIGTRGILALTACPSLSGLTTLRLDDNCLGDLGISYLVGSPICRTLEKLDLYGNRIGPVGVAAIANSPYLKSLRSLRLDGNRFGGEGVRILAASDCLPRLKELTMGGTDMFDDCIPALRKLYARLGSGFDSWAE